MKRSRQSQICDNKRCRTSTTPLWRKGWKKLDGSYARLCNACGLHWRKGHFCPNLCCMEIYKEHDTETFDANWTQCTCCTRWAHKECIQRADAEFTEKQKSEIGTDLNRKSPKRKTYICPDCEIEENPELESLWAGIVSFKPGSDLSQQRSPRKPKSATITDKIFETRAPPTKKSKSSSPSTKRKLVYDEEEEDQSETSSSDADYELDERLSDTEIKAEERLRSESRLKSKSRALFTSIKRKRNDSLKESSDSEEVVCESPPLPKSDENANPCRKKDIESSRTVFTATLLQTTSTTSMKTHMRFDGSDSGSQWLFSVESLSANHKSGGGNCSSSVKQNVNISRSDAEKLAKKFSPTKHKKATTATENSSTSSAKSSQLKVQQNSDINDCYEGLRWLWAICELEHRNYEHAQRS